MLHTGNGGGGSGGGGAAAAAAAAAAVSGETDAPPRANKERPQSGREWSLTVCERRSPGA